MLNSKNPVAIFANGLGDSILTLPSLRALANIFPKNLTLICQNGISKVFFRNIGIQRFCELDFIHTKCGRIFDVNSAVGNIEKCDLLLSLNPWHNILIDRFIHKLNPDNSIGFFDTFKVALPLDYRKHFAELAFDLPRYLIPKLKLENFSKPPSLPNKSLSIIEEFKACIPEGFRLLVVHPETDQKKMWNLENYERLFNIFLSRHPQYIIFIVGAKELKLDLGIFKERIITLYGYNLTIVMALIKEADLFLGIDSCMLHVADFFRIPGVGLFGPTDFTHWGFRFSTHRHISGDGLMQNIKVEQVLEGIESLISQLKLI